MKPAAQTRILPVVILALFVFAGLKAANLWISFGAADAQDVLVAPSGAPTTDASAAGTQAAGGSAGRHGASPPNPPPGEVERRILETLAARRAALDLREKEIRAREAVLAAAEKQLDDKIAFFERERAELTTLREENAQAETKELAALVSAYERMKPKDAAAIFNALEEDILVPVAAGMRTQALAGVLAEMAPENARKLTIWLAERNHLQPPREAAIVQ